jgi:hypothetical protein
MKLSVDDFNINLTDKFEKELLEDFKNFINTKNRNK